MDASDDRKGYRVWVAVGAIVAAAGIAVLQFYETKGPYYWVGIGLTFAGLAGVGVGFILGRDRLFGGLDERFLLHRLKATRLSLVAGLLAIAFFVFYDFLAHDVLRWEYLVVLGVILAAKLGAMGFYRLKR